MYTIKTYSKLNAEVLGLIQKFHHFSEVPPINTEPFFYEMFNKYLLGDWKALFILVHSDDNCIGMLPLMELKYKRKGILPYRKLKFFGATSSDFCDILAYKDKKETVLKEGLKWLFNKNYKWEEIVLDDLLEATYLIKPIRQLTDSYGIPYMHKQGSYFYIDLNQSWDDVKKGMSKSFVFKNLRLANNRITKAGTWEVLYNPSLSAKEIIHKVKNMHIKRQDVLHRQSIFENKKDRQFFENIISKNLAVDEFQTFWLNYEGKDIAYMLGFFKNNIFYWWNTAFDPDYHQFYPTRILQFHTIKFMFEQNYSEFNFMRGESDYKDKWTNTTRKNHRFIIRNNKSLYGRFLLKIDEILGTS
jgi:CelD/BcsL family acetyltransferase involved in cellulose biosynthesis